MLVRIGEDARPSHVRASVGKVVSSASTFLVGRESDKQPSKFCKALTWIRLNSIKTMVEMPR